MLKNIVIAYSLIAVYIVCLAANIITRKDYGEYEIRILRFESCKGPKRLDCYNLTSSIESSKRVVINYYIKDDLVPTSAHITSTMNNKTMLKLQVKRPCKNVYLKRMLKMIPNTFSNCTIVQGHHFLDFDIDKMLRQYYGNVFLYGHLTFKNIFYNEECNLACSVIDIIFSPKHKT